MGMRLYEITATVEEALPKGAIHRRAPLFAIYAPHVLSEYAAEELVRKLLNPCGNPDLHVEVDAKFLGDFICPPLLK